MADINDILSNLNSGYEQVTDLIPDMRVFVDDFTYARNEYGNAFNDEPLGSKLHRLSNGKYIWVGIDGGSPGEECPQVQQRPDLGRDLRVPRF